jgi:hypothetical protein
MLRNMRKALVAVVSVHIFHVRFLSKITPTYFTWFAEGICLPFSVRKATMGEADGLSLLFVTLNVSALTPRLYCGKTALELSGDMTLFAISGI